VAKTTRSPAALDAAATRVRQLALGYPQTYEEAPWGDRVVKVRGKIFLAAGVHDGTLHVSVKLPRSGRRMLERPDAEPTHYGMGKHGWVTFHFGDAGRVPFDLLRAGVDESYRAVAPRRLVDALGQSDGTPAAAPKEKPGRVAGRVLIVCADPLRAARAAAALKVRGVRARVVASAELARLGAADALIIDVGRRPAEGLALASAVDASEREIHLFVVGAHAAALRRSLAALGSATCFRQPPGDPEVVDQVVRALAPAR
jgi:predicted DNA-binding protein (MmcQ/YjbR family)